MRTTAQPAEQHDTALPRLADPRRDPGRVREFACERDLHCTEVKGAEQRSGQGGVVEYM